jgi:hypothetical protein
MKKRYKGRNEMNGVSGWTIIELFSPKTMATMFWYSSPISIPMTWVLRSKICFQAMKIKCYLEGFSHRKFIEIKMFTSSHLGSRRIEMDWELGPGLKPGPGFLRFNGQPKPVLVPAIYNI